MQSYPFTVSSLCEAVQIDYGDIKDDQRYDKDTPICSKLNITKQYYSLFPKTSRELIRRKIKEIEDDIVSNLAGQLAGLIIDDDLSRAIRVGIPANKMEMLYKAFENSLDHILTPYLYEHLSNDQKKKIILVCEKIFTSSDVSIKKDVDDKNPKIETMELIVLGIKRSAVTPMSQQEIKGELKRGKIADQCIEELKNIFIPYFTEKKYSVLKNVPVIPKRVEHEGKKFEGIYTTLWSEVVLHEWLDVVLADLEEVLEYNWYLEPYLIKELQFRGMALHDFFLLESGTRESIFNSAKSAYENNEEGVKGKTVSKTIGKIPWCSSEEHLDTLLKILAETDCIEASEIEEVKDHFNIIIIGVNSRVLQEPFNGNHKIQFNIKVNDLMYLFKKLKDDGYIPVEKSTSKNPYGNLHDIVYNHSCNQDGTSYKLDSLRLAVTKLKTGKAVCSKNFLNDVMKKISKFNSIS